jgi:magnesium chelatase family protein
MSFSRVYGAQTHLLQAHIIHVEVDLSKGLHSFSIVGLPDKAIEESRDRVSAAIKNSGFKSPKHTNHKVVISLAPAHIKKEGATFDLAIAIGYLLAAEDIEFNAERKIFIGELSLDGELRRIAGILPIVKKAKENGYEEIFVPMENAREAALIEGITIYGAHHIQEVIQHINIKKDKIAENNIAFLTAQPRTEVEHKEPEFSVNFNDVKGQDGAKRGLEIAAAGGHNLAMFGPAGTGKTMLAKAFCHLLPPLTFDEMLETTSIHSVAGTLKEDLITYPPFRSPHHTSSYVSLVGGGAFPKPGEITLAHRGVLFLDEFPEFERRVIDSLRQPLEERMVSVARAKGTVSFPANFILIAALNPCSCGNFGIKGRICTCSPISVERYQRKISGPIIDRIDLWIEVSTIDHEKLSNKHLTSDSTETIKKRIVDARKIQTARFENNARKIKTNSEMGARDIENYVQLDKEVRDLLNTSARKLDLSARAYHRIIKLSRTIADLSNSAEIGTAHVLEALQYRPKRLNP